MRIVLASNSPRRRELLALIGLRDFEVIPPRLDECAAGNLSPAELVTRLSAAKAAEVSGLAPPDALVIAADTVVVMDGEILGKPEGGEDAFNMLRALSGRGHTVYTGLTVRRGAEIVTEHERTEVVFRPLTSSEIRDYIATGEPLDKAGAYGIQGYGSLLVQGVRGDYFNVMGLPVNRLGRILVGFGVDCLQLAAAGKERSF